MEEKDVPDAPGEPQVPRPRQENSPPYRATTIVRMSDENPTIWDGKLSSGEYYRIRYRFGTLALLVANSAQDLDLFSLTPARCITALHLPGHTYVNLPLVKSLLEDVIDLSQAVMIQSDLPR